MSSRRFSFDRLGRDGADERIERAVPVEHPVAIEVNGFGYAVMMATPADLDDFAWGFAHAERLIDAAADIVDVDAHDTGEGTIVRITLREALVERIAGRVRHRASETSCGLCGIENIEQALRPLPALEPQPLPDRAAIFAALDGLRTHQPLNAETGAVHAAALCGGDGAILLAREDVGRHNAFDKLIGAMLREGRDWDGGFALLSARCSYELVEKAALAGCPTLVTISAPTSLALDRAKAAGLNLVVLARPDAVLVARG